MTSTRSLPLLTFAESDRQIAAGSHWIPGGSSSDYRRGAGSLVIERAEGGLLFDVDGNRLIDYYCGAGPIILGHDRAEVVDAVARQITRGVQLGGETEEEYEAARLVTELVPSAEMVRFANTGSEAVHVALRIARGATGRQTVLKFEGHYHGWFDSVFSWVPRRAATGSGRNPSELASEGQDPSALDHLEILPWIDLEAVEARLASNDIAAVIVEPLWRGYIRPPVGYLEGLRELCSRHGTILIFDEIVSGFRVAVGGAQALLGVTPDLTTLAKALANGYPIGAVAGRRDLMSLLGGGPVVHPGTYNGNALVSAAAAATLRVLSTGEPHETIERSGRALMAGITRHLDDQGVVGIVQGEPASFSVLLARTEPIRSMPDTLDVDDDAGMRLTMTLLERGVRTIQGGHWYVNAAHTDELVAETLDVFGAALEAM